MANTRGTVSRITVEVKREYGILGKMMKAGGDIEFRVGTMYHMGKMARRYLKKSPWLRTKSPGTLKFKGMGKNKRGAWKVHNWVTKRGTATIFTAPPLNLFEFGRKFSGRDREPGRHILTSKFKDYLERNASRLGNIALMKAFKDMGHSRGISVA